MKFNYAVMPETYKLTKGMGHIYNSGMVKDYPKSLELVCAKNDTCAFQLLLTADEAFSVVASDMPYFAQKRRSTLRVKTECEYEAEISFVDLIEDDDRFMRGDMLSCDAVREVEKKDTVALYFEVKVPEQAQAGESNIKISLFLADMFEDEKKVEEINLTLTVYDFSMSDTEDFYLDIWQHNCAIAKYYGCALWSDKHFEIMRSFLEPLAKAGQKAVTLILSDAPWSGQWCHLEERAEANLYEFSIASVTKKLDGSFSYDFSNMQRYIDMCAELGIKEEISLYGLVNVWCDPLGGFEKLTEEHPDGHKIRYFDEAEGVYKYIRTAAGIDAYIKALHDYFVESEQIDRVRVVADEPADTAAYRMITDHIKELAPRFVFKAAINHSEFIGEFKDTVVDYVPNLESWSKESDKIEAYRKELKDSRFLWYVCNQPPHPNTLLSSDLCEALFIGVVTSYMGMAGFLRWGYTVWTKEPAEDMRYFTWPAGDLFFVYPGKDAKPLSSLRFKALCRGIGLCRILNAYKARFGKEKADALCEKVILETDVKKFFVAERTVAPKDQLLSVNYEDYNAIRSAVLSELSEK